MVINSNLSSLFASRQTNLNASELQKSMERLSSGNSINKAGDDASGMAVSEKMRSQIRGLNQASKNIGSGVNFVQTAEGYLNETTGILQRMRELSVQSANGIFTDADRTMIQVEVSSLVAEIDRIASTAQFNGMNIFTGGYAETPMQFQIGANMNQNIKVFIGTMTSQALGLTNLQETISLATADEANNSIGVVDEALQKVSKQRGNLGVYQNRMEMMQKGIDIASENLVAADSGISDTDMAKEMVEFTKNSILTQASTAMLAQANTQSTNVLSLLK